jgi:5-methyltetrahydrofolate--homocysteine methyltransferase
MELAIIQIAAKADVLDINVGYPEVDNEKLLPKTIKMLQDNFDIPLCFDSPNPKAVEAALKVVRGKFLINSVNGEEHTLKAILPIAKEYGAVVIGLTMDDEGINYDPQKRFHIAEKSLGRAIKIGIKQEAVFIDLPAISV